MVDLHVHQEVYVWPQTGRDHREPGVGKTYGSIWVLSRETHTPDLWVHDSKKTIFSLVVEIFCFQYCSTEDANCF